MNHDCNNHLIKLHTMDTVWQTYLVVKCVVCDKKYTIPISRETYREIAQNKEK